MGDMVHNKPHDEHGPPDAEGRRRDLGEVFPTGSMPGPPATQPMVSVWPHLLMRELLAVLGVSILLLLLSIVFDAPLEAPADPSLTPNPAKAPWYFVGFQELLVYFDPWIAGVLVPCLIILGLCAIPYLDPSRRGEGVYSANERPFAWTIFTTGIIGWFLLIAVGLWFRGAGWGWHWPWGPPGTGAELEARWSPPVLVGLPLLALYFGGGCYLLERRFRRWPGLTRTRRVVLAALLLCMAAVALKIAARLLFGLHYWVRLDSLGLNV